MATEFPKSAAKTAATGEDATRRIVAEMLAEIEAGGGACARAYGEKLDGFDGDIVVAPQAVEAATARVPRQLEDGLKMEGHARAGDVRLEKYFPDETFVLTP